MKRDNQLCYKIVAAIAIPLIFFSALELFLRISPWNKMLGPHRFDGGLQDHSLFWDPKNIVKIPIGEYRLKNEFRGRKVSINKPKNVYRIICLGGSFTYGWPYNNNPSIAYPAVLEKLLNALSNLGRKYEVINAGIGGYTSYQSLFYFKSRLYKLKPDLVIICFGANDSNNNYEIGIFCSDKEYYERLFAFSNHRILFGMKGFLDNLRIYALMERLVFDIKKVFIKPEQRVFPSDFGSNLREFVDLAKIYHFELLFITEPHRNLDKFEEEIVANPYYNVMYKIAKENQKLVKLVNTISLVRKYKPDKIFYDVMHLKPLGHKIVAESIVEILQESGFLN